MSGHPSGGREERSSASAARISTAEEGESSSSSSLASRSLRSRWRGGEVLAEMSGESSNNIDVWPEPFVEAVARQVAVEAAAVGGALEAAAAVVTVFQVHFWHDIHCMGELHSVQ